MAHSDGSAVSSENPLVLFLLHTLEAIAVFLIVALPAVGIDFFVKWLTKMGISPMVVYGLTLAEYGIFLDDLALFFYYLVINVWRIARRV